MVASTLQSDHVDTVFRAFSDRTRLRIMNLLLGREELCVCDLISVLELPQAKVSRHLAYLRKAGLVEGRRNGQWVYYRLSPAKGKFHVQMLACLKCCTGEVPELKDDRVALKGLAKGACGPACRPGCC